MPTDDFTAIAAAARARAGMTDAEFDYSLSVRDGRALAELQSAIYEAANRDLPTVQPGDGQEEPARRMERARALSEQVRPQIDAMIAAAKAKTYAGWSVHSSGSIRYADA